MAQDPKDLVHSWKLKTWSTPISEISEKKKATKVPQENLSSPQQE